MARVECIVSEKRIFSQHDDLLLTIFYTTEINAMIKSYLSRRQKDCQKRKPPRKPPFPLIKKRAQLFDISLKRFIDNRRSVVEIQNLRKLFGRFSTPQRKNVFVLMKETERKRDIRKHAPAQGLHRDEAHIAFRTQTDE